MGVKTKTTMIKDLSDVLKKQYDRKSFSILFPNCFNDLLGNDASFEMALSNTLQPLRLVYEHNVATDSIGVVFVHTHLEGTIGDHTKLQSKRWDELKKGIFDGTIDG